MLGDIQRKPPSRETWRLSVKEVKELQFVVWFSAGASCVTLRHFVCFKYHTYVWQLVFLMMNQSLQDLRVHVQLCAN